MVCPVASQFADVLSACAIISLSNKSQYGPQDRFWSSRCREDSPSRVAGHGKPCWSRTANDEDRHQFYECCLASALGFFHTSLLLKTLRPTLSTEKNACADIERTQIPLWPHVCQMRLVHLRLKRTSPPRCKRTVNN